MFTRALRLIPSLATIALGFAISVSGQSQDGNGRYPLKISIVEQSDSPIRLVLDSLRGNGIGVVPAAVDDYYSKAPETVMLELENVSGSAIIAYALVSKGKGFQNVQVSELIKPLWPGNSLLRGFGTGGREEIEYSLDYVLLADGRAWGADKFHRSRQIAPYFDGRNAALEQLRVLSAAFPSPQDFIDQANSFGGYITSAPAGEPDPQTIKTQYRTGWLHIIQMLRGNPKRQKESRELADRLEAEILHK